MVPGGVASRPQLVGSARALPLALLGTALAALTLYPVALALQANQGHDFLLLYAAAHALRDHQNPYDATVFVRYAQAAGVPPFFLLDSAHRLNQPYVYPPVFAWLVIPLTLLKPLTALLIWRVGSAACVFVGSLALTAPWAVPSGTGVFAGRARRLLLAALVTCAPLALYCLYWGNPVVVVFAAMGLWLWALHWNAPSLDWLAGALMSVTLLKPQLALPLALWAALCLTRGAEAWERRRRIALSFGLTCAAWLALDVLVTGRALLIAWPHAVLSLSQMTGTQADTPSLAGLFVGVARLPSWGQTIGSTGLAVLGAGSSVWAYLRLRTRWAPAMLLALLTAIWCATTPYAHANDEILLVPAALVLLAGLAPGPTTGSASSKRRRRTVITRARAAVSSTAIVALWLGGLLWFVGVLIQVTAGLHALPANLDMLAPVLLLIALIARARMEGRVSPSGRGDGGAHAEELDLMHVAEPRA